MRSSWPRLPFPLSLGALWAPVLSELLSIHGVRNAGRPVGSHLPSSVAGDIASEEPPFSRSCTASWEPKGHKAQGWNVGNRLISIRCNRQRTIIVVPPYNRCPPCRYTCPTIAVISPFPIPRMILHRSFSTTCTPLSLGPISIAPSFTSLHKLYSPPYPS